MDNTPFTDTIREILAQRTFAVVGASRNPEKYGNKVYRALKRHGYKVFAVNPNAETVDGDPAYPRLDNIPEPIDCIVAVVPPHVTEQIMREAGRLHIPYVWMQPGSESEAAVNAAVAHGLEAVHGGPCIMVAAAAHRPEQSD